MNTEQEIIKRILGNFRKSEFHKNEFFHSDSEIIQLGNTNYLITVDSFSDEDHFRLDNPFILGKNLASCTLSDIFACGGQPIFFCNSLCCENSWGSDYINSIAIGISQILNETDTGFIGGDLGIATNWSFTGIAIGISNRIVTRKGATKGDLIYITGEIGKGNFEAGSNLIKNNNNLELLFNSNRICFPVRLKESNLISKYASSSIDTSDGVFNSLRIISEINNIGFSISNLPYCDCGLQLTNQIGLPKEILFFGECGEYELLFTINPENERDMLNDAKDLGSKLYKIGEITGELAQTVKIDGKNYVMDDFNLSARDFDNHFIYIRQLTEYLNCKCRNNE